MLEELVRDYGYWAIIIGTFFEGETIVIIGGLFAMQGTLSLPLVILSGLGGSFAGDQTWFWVGRHWGKKMVAKWPRLQGGVDRVTYHLDKHATVFILTFRFFYGLRNISPIAIALGGVSSRRYFFLNLIAAIIWAISFGGAGYLFGHALEATMGNLHNAQMQIYAVLGLIFGIVIVHQVIKAKMKKKDEAVVHPHDDHPPPAEPPKG